LLSADHEKVRSSVGKLPVKPEDDDSIGDSCFGMCGNGCSSAWSCRGFEGWSHQWVGSPTTTVRAWCACNLPDRRDEPDCENFVPGSFKTIVWVTSGPAVHTITGWSSEGCIAHDGCCRTSWLGCYDPLCQPFAIWAAADCMWKIGWEVSWSYIGDISYRSEAVDPTSCRNDCPACGDWNIPPPMEVPP
jgi:hypothetical protein